MPNFKSYMPRHIFVRAAPKSNTLLELENQRDALTRKIAVERMRLFGLEPTGESNDYGFWHLGLMQTLFDQLGHYDSNSVWRICVCWLIFNHHASDLTDEVRAEVDKMFDECDLKLSFDDESGTYTIRE